MVNAPPIAAIRKWYRNSLPFWLILPTIIILLIVQFYPAVYTGWLSFQDRTPSGWNYVGLENFTRLFRTGIFGESVGHTIIFLVGYTLLTVSAGFIIAFLLKQNVRFSGFYVTLLFIPWIIADIIAGLVFRLLVAPEYGLFSGILQNPDLIPPNGLSVLTANRPTPWVGDFPFPPSPAMIYSNPGRLLAGLAFCDLAHPGSHANHSQRSNRKRSHRRREWPATHPPYHGPFNHACHGCGAL